MLSSQEKGIVFEKYSAACKGTEFDSLLNLILLEEFNKCLPGRTVHCTSMNTK